MGAILANTSPRGCASASRACASASSPAAEGQRLATCPRAPWRPETAPPRSHVVPHTLVTFTLSLSYSARVPLRRAGADARHARSGPRAIDKLLSLSSRSVSWLSILESVLRHFGFCGIGSCRVHRLFWNRSCGILGFAALGLVVSIAYFGIGPAVSKGLSSVFLQNTEKWQLCACTAIYSSGKMPNTRRSRCQRVTKHRG